MSRVARKGSLTIRRINLSVRMPGHLASEMSISLAEVYPWTTAYVSEQHRFWRDCADAQARQNLCC